VRRCATVANVLQMGRWKRSIAARAIVAVVTVPVVAACAIAVTPSAAHAALATADSGYRVVDGSGTVYDFGAKGANASFLERSNGTVVGIASTPSGRGYWLVGADGGVFAFGDAGYFGSGAGRRLKDPVVGIAATPSGRGYWLVGADGGVFAFGDARYRGSGARNRLNVPVVGMAATHTGDGYWLVGADGGVFAYGDAPFQGSALLQSAQVAVRGTNGVYRHGTTGYDISWPQCGAPYPDPPHDVTVVGVNDGHMYSRNPCLASQAAWAGRSLTLYVNVDGLPNDATSGLTGPRGACALTDIVCRSYNYGRNGLEYDLAYAKRLGVASSMWWLDVEVEPIWRTGDPLSNANVIQGVLDGLRAHRLTAGIYSTNYQWGAITGGGYNPRTPIWVAGPSTFDEAKAYCSPSYAFGGGTTWLTQWSTHFDHAYAC